MYGTVPDGTTTDVRRPAGPARLPLTRGRRAALVFGVPVCLACVLAIAFSLVGNLGRGSFAVRYPLPPGAAGVSVSSAGGDLSLRQAAQGRGGFTGTASYSLIRPHLTETFSAGQVAVGYRCVVPTGDCGLSGTLSIPSGTPLSVNTGGGNVTARDISGQLTISTSGGGLKAEGLTGDLALSTGGGDINATTVAGPEVTADTAGGELTATSVTTPQVIADTGGGDAQIVFTRVPRDVQVSSAGGSVTIIVPPGSTTYHVIANAAGGNISDDVPPSTSSENLITVTTGGGNITIQQST
jgi:Putative adhesin